MGGTRNLMLAAWVVFIIASMSSVSYAQAKGKAPSQPKISITVDRDPVIAGETFELQINLTVESAGDPVIKLPALGGLRVMSRRESHPQSFQFSFGFGGGSQGYSRTTRQSVYSFVVVADQPGAIQISPVVVQVDGESFQSQPYTINVKPSSLAGSPGQPVPTQAQPMVPSPSSGQIPEPPAEEVPIDASEIDPNYFLQLAVSKDECLLGEMIIVNVYLYTAWGVSEVQMVREPGTEGFWAETIDTGSRSAQREVVQVGDTQYERVVLRKLALFPVRAGELEVGPAVADILVRQGGFFSSRKTVKRAAKPVKVKVNPLPAEGRPQGFDDANVGQVTFRATVDKDQVKTGEPVTLKLSIQGTGNVRNMKFSDMGDVEGFKVYTPEIEVAVDARGENVVGTRISKYLMIPKGPGVYEIPSMEWSYFDPVAGKYQTRKTRARQITVSGGELSPGDPAAPSKDGKSVKEESYDKLNRKLRSIATRTDLSMGSAATTMTRPWFIAVVFVTPVSFLCLVIFQGIRRRRERNIDKGRSRRADTVALKKLAEIGKVGQSGTSEEFFAGLQRVMLGFLEDRLEEPIAGDTMLELAARLKSRGFSEELASQVISEMEAYEFARFARSAGGPQERTKGLDRARDLIGQCAGVRVSPFENKSEGRR